jgi:hypothetical protein
MILFDGEGARRDETRYRLESGIVADAADGGAFSNFSAVLAS